ncbi:MAG: glycosyltransferase family 1 protein [bacterium]
MDIQSAVSQRAGVGRYTRNLVEHLAPLIPAGNELNLFYFDFHRRGLDFPCPGAHKKAIHWIPGKYVKQAWKRLNGPPFDWFAGKADLYHFPNFTIPPLSRGKKIVTIHDMSFLRHPEFSEDKNLEYLSAFIHDSVRRADAIITISEFSKKETSELLGVDPGRIFATPLGVTPGCARPPTAQIAESLRRMKLERPYLLTVGTLEPRKNIRFLIDVFEQLTEFDGDLVIAGMKGWKVEPILQRMQSSSRRDRIRYLEYVPDNDLFALYAGAELFVISSFYEGFGLPPLEALACGTPVVSSTGGSLPEILTGKASVLIPGFEVTTWASTIFSLLNDQPRRNELARNATSHAARFSWRDTAQKTLNVYRKVLS